MELKQQLDSEFLPFVNKPARYIGHEYNEVIKDPLAINIRVALCFPDLYEAGIRNVSFELMYHLLNTREDTWAERCFAPDADAEACLRQKGLPLFSLGSKTALKDFDLAVFYAGNELDGSNILNMLDLGGIELRSEQRNAGPVIIGFGPAFNNPEPLAVFCDGIIIGEAEGALLAMLELYAAATSGIDSGKELLKQFSEMPGIYIPAFYQPQFNAFEEFQGMDTIEANVPQRISKRAAQPDAPYQHILNPLIALAELPKNRHEFEVIGGFTSEEKKFAANRLSAPLSQQQLENLFRESQKIWRKTEGTQVSALMVNDAGYSEAFWQMIKESAMLEGQKIRFGPSALKLMIAKAELNEFAATLKANGFSISPIAASQRLRSVLNIHCRDHELFSVVKVALERGWQRIRLNFMVGLPTEKPADVDGIGQFIKECLKIGAAYSDVEFIISVQGFSPRSHTPFQWEKQENAEVIQSKFTRLSQQLDGLPLTICFKDPLMTSLETALSRGDRSLADVIENAWRSGARFDKVNDTFQGDLWKKAFSEAGKLWNELLSPKSITVALPWDHIDVGASRTALKEEKLEALQGRIQQGNKGFVSIGYGVKRSDFENFLQENPEFRGTTEGNGLVAPKITYGRRGKKIQSTEAVIKRRIRVRYAKTGIARFLSHSDTIKAFSRSAALAKIPLVRSKSTKKTPKISYATPLPSGIASSAEYLDMEVELGREMNLEDQFNKHLPEGIQILQYQGIYSNTPALAASINLATYKVPIQADVIAPEQLSSWIAALLDQTETHVQRTVKTEQKSLNIRPFLGKLLYEDNQLLVDVAVIEGKTARITEILEALLEPHGIDYRLFPIQRTGQFIARDEQVKTPFE